MKDRPTTAKGPFLSSTSYNYNYRNYDVQAPPGPVRAKAFASGMPFNPHTSYRDTYGKPNGGGVDANYKPRKAHESSIPML